VETLWREKPLRGSQTQDIHYTENKASYKTLVLTYPYAVVIPLTLTRSPSWTLHNQVSYLKGYSIDSFTLWPIPKIDFTRIVWAHTGNGLRASESSILPKHPLKAKRIQHRILYNWQAKGPLFRNSTILSLSGPRPDSLAERLDCLRYNSFLRSNGTLEYSEMLDSVWTCCHVIRTTCNDFPNSVNF